MTALAIGSLVSLAVAACLSAGSHATVRAPLVVAATARPRLPGACAVVLARLRRVTGRFATRRRFHRSLPRYVEAVARELRAGAPMRVAILDGAHATGGPFRSDAERLRHRLDAGQTVAEVLRWWAADRRSPELARLALVSDAGRRVGGELARALDGIAAAMADQRDVAAEARSLSSQARASAVLLVAAPIVVCVVMSGVEPAANRFLFGTPAGWTTLMAALCLDLAGGCWMYRLTERVR